VRASHRVGFEKLRTFLGRFDTYTGGVWGGFIHYISDMFLVTGGKGGVRTNELIK
jgi:hypothetical protein